jgi:hypothetical protein
MSTTTFTAELPRARFPRLRSPRLVNAELLKLRKRRGLVAATLALTVLPMLVAYTVMTIMHAVEPTQHGPAGGASNFAGSLNLLGALVLVASVLVGATVGTGDLGAGVFRELIVVGRSRLMLFAARVPAGLGFLLVPVGIAFGISAAASTFLNGSLDPPGTRLLLDSGGWLTLVAALGFAVSLGVSSLIGSRGTAIGVLLGWLLVAMPILQSVHVLGGLRDGLVGSAVERFEPTAVLGGPPQVPMSLAAAAVVAAAWTVVPLALGAWRTQTRDA